MKRIINSICILCALLPLMTGCQQPVFDFQVSASHFLTATLERKAETKTHLGDPVEGVYYPCWTSGDQLAVYVDGINAPDKYMLFGGAGTEKGSFSGTVTGSRYVALYPYSDRTEEGLEGETLHMKLPTEQAYVKGSFGEGSFPMIAVSQDAASLSFQNLCAVLKISMTGTVAVQAVHFTANDPDLPVAGPATVRTDFSTAPELIMDKGGERTVTLRCVSVPLDAETPTDFFIVIPPGTYKGGFTLEVETFSGKFEKKITSDVTFARSQFRHIAPFACEPDGTIDPDNIPYNQIWYVSDDGRKHNLRSTECFNCNIVSHTYEDGKGVIVLDGTLTTVGKLAFYYSTHLKEVRLPNSVESIGVAAFQFSGIEAFHVPDNLSSVGAVAFNRCQDLKRFYGKNVSSDEKFIVLQGKAVAYAGGAITDPLVVPEGVRALDKQLFQDESNLRNVILPDGLESIGNSCFANCSSLETVSLPRSLKSIESESFYDCPSLREFKGDCPLCPDGLSLVDENGMIFVFIGNGLSEYTVPAEVTQIGPSAFKNKKELRSLKFTSTLTNLYSGCFTGCDQLEFFYGKSDQISEDHHCMVFYGDYLVAVTAICPADYTIPDNMGIQRTFYTIFSGNSSIVRLTLPDAVHTAYDFSNMPNLQTLRLSAELSTLGSNAFASCPKLDTIYLRSSVPPSFSEDEYAHIGHPGLVVYVPEGSEDLYKSASGWSGYAQYIKGYNYEDIGTPDYYISTDYSEDGNVTRIQTASKGNGIDIVLMGDGFSDRQLADGTYHQVMRKMAEAFFSEEPYKSFRDHFNVYAVNAISQTEGYEHGGHALGGWFGEGTQVGGNDTRCLEYARHAVTDEQMDNTLIIVAMNSTAHGGTCYMYDPSSDSADYGCGTSVAYFPIGETDDGLAQLVHHEAGGHGFAKLADEYAYEGNGTVPEPFIESHRKQMPLGWWKNADFTGDREQVKWAKFLDDSRYQYDGLGIFEGAFTYWRGAWRPTENSIMRHNRGGFNAPSREAIWYRIHKLAYGDSWKYDYEKFVEYDAMNRKTSSSAGTYAPMSTVPARPTHPPVVRHQTWRAYYEGKVGNN